MRPTDFALFLDLDHTIFDTESISSELLAPFLSTILKLNPHLSEQKFKVAREELWVSSLAEVSNKYCFSKESITQGLEQLGKIPLE